MATELGKRGVFQPYVARGTERTFKRSDDCYICIGDIGDMLDTYIVKWFPDYHKARDGSFGHWEQYNCKSYYKLRKKEIWFVAMNLLEMAGI